MKVYSQLRPAVFELKRGAQYFSKLLQIRAPLAGKWRPIGKTGGGNQNIIKKL